MSYIVRPRRRLAAPMPRRRGRPGLGNWFDDLIQGVTGVPTPDAIAQAQDQQSTDCSSNAVAGAASLKATIDDLDATWHPSGYYTVQQFTDVLASAAKMATSAWQAMQDAPVTDRGSFNATLDKLHDMTLKAGDYFTQRGDAINKGATVIDAAGLRDFVIDSMRASYDAIVEAGYQTCMMPWWASAIITFQGIFNSVAAVVKKVVGVVATAADTVYKVASDLPEIWTIVKWGGIAVGAIWAITKIAEMRRKAHA